MGIRTRGLDIGINAKRQAADAAARAEAKGVLDRWNEQLAAGREMLWSRTISAADAYKVPLLLVTFLGYWADIPFERHQHWRRLRVSWDSKTANNMKAPFGSSLLTMSPH